MLLFCYVIYVFVLFKKKLKCFFNVSICILFLFFNRYEDNVKIGMLWFWLNIEIINMVNVIDYFIGFLDG